ncbi:hypothetical protein A1OO_11030 [Enterovibrio norvegicus FF-33]|nr:hypothetical protein A1OO_11030 [Enterovibrio norvegicus FF-33]OEE89194.1 hypothetical protein A1OQ_12115 [Enterovibrio norvegicus FF-162]
MMRSVLAMLRKEWLENPLVLRIPLFLFACGFLLFVSVMSNSSLQNDMSFQMSIDGDASDIHHSLGDSINGFIAGAAGLLSILLGTHYFPRTLRKARTEGSIMFWRSMPVSDVKTHVVKLTFGLLVIPLVCSILVLAANMMLWILNVSTEHQLALFQSQASLGNIFVSWITFLLRMVFAGVLLLPLALSAMAISQKVNSPLIVMFIAVCALKWMPIVLLGFYGIDDFFSAIFSLPLNAIIYSNPLSAIPEAGWFNVAIYTLCGVMAGATSLKFSRTA